MTAERLDFRLRVLDALGLHFKATGRAARRQQRPAGRQGLRRWGWKRERPLWYPSIQAMPARDLLHDAVRSALVRDGWTITHDPLRLNVPGRNLYVDLGAERLLAAERGAVQIAVEVKSFLGPSDVRDLEEALGQFLLYDFVLDG